MRSIRESDQELYCELFCDPETMRHIGPPWTRAAAARAFRGVLQATRARAAASACSSRSPRKDAQRPIGLCTLQNFDRTRRQAELGLMIVPSGRAHGFATEALIAVIAHAFATLPFDELWVRFAIDHAAAEQHGPRAPAWCAMRTFRPRTGLRTCGAGRHTALVAARRAGATGRKLATARRADRQGQVSVHCSAAQG